jgi:hypothetical protein
MREREKYLNEGAEENIEMRLTEKKYLNEGAKENI